MIRRFFALFLILFAASSLSAKKQDKRLSKKIRADESSKSIVVDRLDAWVRQGIVKMETVHENGSVIFYISGGRDGELPVIEVNNRSESSFISLFVDGQEFRLNKSKSVDFSFDVSDRAFKVTYTLPNNITLEALYTFARTEPDNKEIPVDSIKVSYSVFNGDKEAHEFALKAVYNTVLGESRTSHFSTSSMPDVLSEREFVPSAENNWVISSNGKYALEFILFGKGVTPPSRFAVANKNIIEDSTPETHFKEGRAFSSLLTYNNSSAAMFWNPVKLPGGSKAIYAYRLNFSTTDFQNAGYKKNVVAPAQPAAPAPREKEASEQKTETPPVEEPKKEEKKDEKLNYNFDTDLSGIDPSKLNAEYVQQLINHINSLEQSDPSLNRMKIQQLQTEVDEVLQVLRSRK